MTVAMAAPVGVVDHLGGGPFAQLCLVVGQQPREQDAQVAVADGGDPRRKLRPHVVDGPRRAQHALVLAKPLEAVLRGMDAPNR